jgi:hypothetical protein
MYFYRNRFYAIAFAVINACISASALLFSNEYTIVTLLASCSFCLFALICWLEKANMLFLARTFILGSIGYFPMFIKVILGKEALFSAYEHSTQGFQIVVLMYVTTSFALLSNEIGLAMAKRDFSDQYKRKLAGPNIRHRFQFNLMSIRVTYWGVAGFVGIGLVFFSSYIFIRGYGQTVITAGYAEVKGGEGIAFGSVGVLGAVGMFSVFVAGLKGYFPFWKPIFLALFVVFIIYSQLLMGLRQDAMSVIFGLIIIYNLIKQKENAFKPSYLPLAMVFYIFFESWGVARTLIAEGYSILSILESTFSQIQIGELDSISLGTISPISTTFSNIVFLIDSGKLEYSFGRSYWEWFLRIPPEILYPDRPVDYSWIFESFGLIAGGGFFELAEVYMNFGIIGALFIPGLISFIIAKSYFFVLTRQTMLSYFLLFGFLAVFLRGTWYQTFAFVRALQVCILLYLFCVFIVEILRKYRVKRMSIYNYMDENKNENQFIHP